MEKPKKEVSKKQLILKLASFCAYQERCISDLYKQFDKYDTTGISHQEVIDELIEEKFINELRFAKSVTRGKFNVRKWGRNKIRQYLQLKSIDKYDIDKALKEIPSNKYLEACQSLVDKKMESLAHKELSDFDKKQKVIASLLQKGYEFDIIKETI